MSPFSKIDYFSAFKYEDDELEQFFTKVDPGNTVLTKEMEDYEGYESIIEMGSKRVRLMFYVDN